MQIEYADRVMYMQKASAPVALINWCPTKMKTRVMKNMIVYHYSTQASYTAEKAEKYHKQNGPEGP
jgi:hypothetical protein